MELSVFSCFSHSYYLLTCYLYVDRLVKLHQLLMPTSFQW